MENKIRAIVVSISDTRTEDDDVSGDVLTQCLRSIGAEILEKLIVTDDFEGLRQTLYSLTESEANLILTTGGTGFAERDNTPEATLAVIEREAPGISEAMRFETMRNTKFAMLSRGVSGIRNGTLVINLPGSPNGVAECFAILKDILPHAIRLIEGESKH
ncbi:MAG: MogA/MoaB family molybdenum cofactor biosynthesis protein [Pyrinomonadaceae bacterium]|nr:MogA/MoaB family molybdenum cofactor biosynthesis protein [Pyrinomonadaceae bacterium]